MAVSCLTSRQVPHNNMYINIFSIQRKVFAGVCKSKQSKYKLQTQSVVVIRFCVCVCVCLRVYLSQTLQCTCVPPVLPLKVNFKTFCRFVIGYTHIWIERWNCVPLQPHFSYHYTVAAIAATVTWVLSTLSAHWFHYDFFFFFSLSAHSWFFRLTSSLQYALRTLYKHIKVKHALRVVK